jgi:hypothetical protein
MLGNIIGNDKTAPLESNLQSPSLISVKDINNYSKLMLRPKHSFMKARKTDTAFPNQFEREDIQSEHMKYIKHMINTNGFHSYSCWNSAFANSSTASWNSSS